MRFIKSFLFLVTLSFSAAAYSTHDKPDYVGKYKVGETDIADINQVIKDFQKAIITKNGDLLTSLVMNEDIFFHSVVPAEKMDYGRKQLGPDFNGLTFSGFKGFRDFITKSPDQNEEKFYNTKILVDNYAALVTFDFTFNSNGKVTNYGHEVWQMSNVDDQWKIVTVFWSSTNRPAPSTITNE